MIKPDGADRFRVDFSLVKRVPMWKRIFARDPVIVDAYAIAQSIILALQRCPFRTASGAPQVWNEYRVFLSREDHDLLRPVESSLNRELMPMLYEEIVRMNAVTVGALMVRLLVDDGEDVRPGTALLHVCHTPDAESFTALQGEITVRQAIGAPAKPAVVEASPPTIVPTSFPPQPTLTERMEVPIAIVETVGGNIELRPDTVYVVGRSHPDAPPEHLALPGAGPRINRRQFSIRLTGNEIEITRETTGANPVRVSENPLAPGQTFTTKLPVEIVLSNGDYRLFIRHPNPALTPTQPW